MDTSAIGKPPQELIKRAMPALQKQQVAKDTMILPRTLCIPLTKSGQYRVFRYTGQLWQRLFACRLPAPEQPGLYNAHHQCQQDIGQHLAIALQQQQARQQYCCATAKQPQPLALPAHGNTLLPEQQTMQQHHQASQPESRQKQIDEMVDKSDKLRHTITLSPSFLQIL